MSEVNNGKKPIYKKWWFITGAAIIIIAAIAGGGKSGKNESLNDSTETVELVKKKEKPKKDNEDENYKFGTWVTTSSGVNVEINLFRTNKYIYTDDLTGASMGQWSGNNSKIVFYEGQYNVPVATGKIDYSGDLVFQSERGILYLKKK